MESTKARSLALSEMRKWGLLTGKRPWNFAFNNRKRALGLCDYRKRTIYLSRYYLDRVSEAETLDTIRHEIAHALEADRHGTGGHGATWKSIAREVGAKPERTCKAKIHHKYTYVVKYEGILVRGYFKLPNNIHERIKHMHVKGRPDTKGKLKLFRVTYKESK